MDQIKPEVFIMIDVETSGPIPGSDEYSMLSLGAVVVGQHTPPYHRSFYAEIQPYGPKVDPGAMAVNKLDIERLKREGVTPDGTMVCLREWVLGVANPELFRPVMVSQGTSDFMWVQWYFHHFEVRSPFDMNSVDMKSMHFQKTKCRWSQTAMRIMKTHYPDNPFTNTHNALDDAISQAEIFHRIRQS